VIGHALRPLRSLPMRQSLIGRVCASAGDPLKVRAWCIGMYRWLLSRTRRCSDRRRASFRNSIDIGLRAIHARRPHAGAARGLRDLE
jgi:hypothetical protein